LYWDAPPTKIALDDVELRDPVWHLAPGEKRVRPDIRQMRLQGPAASWYTDSLGAIQATALLCSSRRCRAVCGGQCAV